MARPFSLELLHGPKIRASQRYRELLRNSQLYDHGSIRWQIFNALVFEKKFKRNLFDCQMWLLSKFLRSKKCLHGRIQLMIKNFNLFTLSSCLFISYSTPWGLREKQLKIEPSYVHGRFTTISSIGEIPSDSFKDLQCSLSSVFVVVLQAFSL